MLETRCACHSNTNFIQVMRDMAPDRDLHLQRSVWLFLGRYIGEGVFVCDVLVRRLPTGSPAMRSGVNPSLLT